MKLLIIVILTIMMNNALAAKYNYDILRRNNHTIHTVTISPKQYEMHFVKAHDQVFGRETVESLALQSDATLAINGGFFEIGNSQDGMPSGNLVIDGKIFALESQKNQECLIQKPGKLLIETCKSHIQANIGNEIIFINKVNKFPRNKEIILYTDRWGSSTLTNFNNRQEITFNSNYNITRIDEHGNVSIPPHGFVLSFPKKYNLSHSLPKDRLFVDLEPFPRDKKRKISILTGIPQIVAKGKINPHIIQNKGSFYTMPHARTALGIKPNGDIVIVVVEHIYKRDLKEVTLNELNSILQNNSKKLIAKYHKNINMLNFNELKEIVQEELSVKNISVGLSITELANLMIELGCDSAINLDGGGSSTMFINGKVVNQSTGDTDEKMGVSFVRPVSDAIIFKSRATADTH